MNKSTSAAQLESIVLSVGGIQFVAGIATPPVATAVDLTEPGKVPLVERQTT